MHDPDASTAHTSPTVKSVHGTSPAPTASERHAIRVGLFAGMAEAAGRRSLEIDWDGGTAAALRRRLADELPHLAPLLARSAVAIGDAYVTDDARIPVGSDVAIIPPVSGG